MSWWFLPVAAAATLEVVSTPAAGQFATVQAAVDAATTGDRIEVGDGVFAGNVRLDVAVTLVGSGLDETVLSVAPNGGQSHVLVADGVDVTFEDLTIDGGGSAGGLRLDEPAHVEVRRVRFRNGRATQGGAIYVQWGTLASVLSSVLCGNTADGIGGGIHIDPGGELFAQQTLFAHNLALGGGGGAAHPDGPSTFINNTFVANHALGGGAIAANADTYLLNNLVAYHQATGRYGSGIEAVQEHGGDFTGGSNGYWSNAGGDAEMPLVNDQVGLDPLLPSSLDCTTARLADVALPPGSPAIGAADPAGALDDMGAVDFDADGDGHGIPDDCDDLDPERNPDAAEVPCDGVDNDCDPSTADGPCGTGATADTGPVDSADPVATSADTGPGEGTDTSDPGVTDTADTSDTASGPSASTGDGDTSDATAAPAGDDTAGLSGACGCQQGAAGEPWILLVLLAGMARRRQQRRP